MTDMLKEMFKTQEAFIALFPSDVIPNSNSYLEKEQQVLMFIGHVIEELIEMRRTLPARKHWSKTRLNKPDWEKTLEEYVDVWHFMINIALAMGWSAECVYEAWMQKSAINYLRQKEGY